jgi:WhiB family redox-sensing transcriptional regulator
MMQLSNELMWTDQANCKGLDTNDFFVPDSSKRYENEPILKRICSACIVKTECLDYALHNNVTGYWGSTTEKTRRTMRQKLGIIAKGLAFEGLYK